MKKGVEGIKEISSELSKSGWECSYREPEMVLCFKNKSQIFIEPFYTLDREGRIVRCGWGFHVYDSKTGTHFDFKLARRILDAKKFAENLMRNWDEAIPCLRKLRLLGLVV